MNLRNRRLVMVLRILFGLFMLFSGVSGFFVMGSMEGIPEPQLAATQVLLDTGLFQLIKVAEVIIGLMLLINFLPWLAMVVMAPLSLGILVVNARISPAFLPTAIIVLLFTGYFVYVYWDKYKPLFTRQQALPKRQQKK